MVRRIQPLYIPFLDDEEFNLDFSYGELDRIIMLWEHGHSISCIAEALGRDPDEIAVLMIDLGRKEMIKRRLSGAVGACSCRE